MDLHRLSIPDERGNRAGTTFSPSSASESDQDVQNEARKIPSWASSWQRVQSHLATLRYREPSSGVKWSQVGTQVAAQSNQCFAPPTSSRCPTNFWQSGCKGSISSQGTTSVRSAPSCIPDIRQKTLLRQRYGGLGDGLLVYQCGQPWVIERLKGTTQYSRKDRKLSSPSDLECTTE